MTRLYSWNINGFRAILKKGFLDWLEAEQPDVLCLQEVKAEPGQLPPDALEPKGYRSVWQPAKRKGYSGLATFYKARHAPRSVSPLGVAEFDDEGRVQMLDYDDYVLVNTYWPNSQPERARIEYKLAFCQALKRRCDALVNEGRHVVICGDGNIAHREIDLARPKENRDNPGFYPEECDFLDEMYNDGYVDAFRHFCDKPGQYTWWSYRAGARGKNIGWRLDYHIVNKGFIARAKEAKIHPAVMGSDHCPVSLVVK